MKQLLFLFLILFSLNAFCDVSDEMELKKRFDEANDAISVDDFPDVLTEKPLNCSYSQGGVWHDLGLISSHGVISVTGVKDGRGPLFPGSNGTTIVTRGIVFAQTPSESLDQSLKTRPTVVLKDGINWVDYPTGNGTANWIFRKSGPYIFMHYTFKFGEYYGYCWREKQ
jgi:hypothetical protein